MKLIELTVQDYNHNTGFPGTKRILINTDNIVTIMDSSFEQAIGIPLYKQIYKGLDNKTGKSEYTYEIAQPAPTKTMPNCQLVLKGYTYSVDMSLDELKALING